jgi:2-dehydropantoate 2-reductase
MATVAVIGAGGVGGLIAARLARGGHEVRLLARGAAAQAIGAHGLKLSGPDGEFTVAMAAVAEDAAALGVVDLVLLAVKAWQVAELAPQLVPLVGPQTTVAPLQNGVEAAEQLAAALGEAQVVGGLCHMLSWVERPGEIQWMGQNPSVTLGVRRDGQAPLVERAAEIVRAGQLHVVVSDAIARALWQKLLFIAPLGAVGAIAGTPAGIFRKRADTRAELEGSMREIVAVAAARGVTLADDAVARALARIDALPDDATASLQRDIQAGRPSELHELIGAVVRLGRAAGVATPSSARLYDALVPREDAARARPA